MNNVERNRREWRRNQPQIRAEDRTRFFKPPPPTISGTQLLWPCDVPLITVKYLAEAQSASRQNSCWKDSPADKLIELRRYVVFPPWVLSLALYSGSNVPHIWSHPVAFGFPSTHSHKNARNYEKQVNSLVIQGLTLSHIGNMRTTNSFNR
jgi:hypothetical protein